MATKLHRFDMVRACALRYSRGHDFCGVFVYQADPLNSRYTGFCWCSADDYYNGRCEATESNVVWNNTDGFYVRPKTLFGKEGEC